MAAAEDPLATTASSGQAPASAPIRTAREAEAQVVPPEINESAVEIAEPDMKRRRSLLQSDSDSHQHSWPPSLVEWFRSALVAVSVETADGSRRETFHIHEGALRQMPYFEAYADRWAKAQEPCKLQLPPDVEMEDFENLIVRIYTVCRCGYMGGLERLRLEKTVDLKRAVAFYLLADMMLVERLMQEGRAAICLSVRTREHVEELRSWSQKPAAKALAKVVKEIESEWEQPFLANLVRSVIGDGNRVLGTPEILEMKSGILQDRLKERADLGLQSPDANIVLDVLRNCAWIGTVYYDQVFKVSPMLLIAWQMVEPNIITESAFNVARGLASELDRPASLCRVSYRGEQRYSLAFSGNRDIAVELLQGIVRVGAKLAEQGMVPWSEVMTVLPKNYESAQFEFIIQPALQVSLFQVELLLPYLKRISLDFLVKLLRTSPRAAAHRIARHVFMDEAALKPSKEVFEVIRELRLV
jgi:hypothetical protein